MPSRRFILRHFDYFRHAASVLRCFIRRRRALPSLLRFYAFGCSLYNCLLPPYAYAATIMLPHTLFDAAACAIVDDYSRYAMLRFATMVCRQRYATYERADAVCAYYVMPPIILSHVGVRCCRHLCLARSACAARRR